MIVGLSYVLFLLFNKFEIFQNQKFIKIKAGFSPGVYDYRMLTLSHDSIVSLFPIMWLYPT